MNKLPIYEWLSDGSEGLDLDLVKKMTIQLILKPDPAIGANKTRLYLIGVEVVLIEWWDSARTKESSTLTVMGMPKEIIRQLVQYKRSHKPDFFSDIDKKGIFITTVEEERRRDSKIMQAAVKDMFDGAMKGKAAEKTAKEALILARDAKPKRHYVAESIIISIVLAVFGLFIWIDPSLTPFLLPAEIAIVVLVLLLYGRFEKWLHSLIHGKNGKGQHRKKAVKYKSDNSKGPSN
jgi:hypothetical protein